jgi:hypothetical protein
MMDEYHPWDLWLPSWGHTAAAGGSSSVHADIEASQSIQPSHIPAFGYVSVPPSIPTIPDRPPDLFPDSELFASILPRPQTVESADTISPALGIASPISMLPPPKPARKPKARTLRVADWNPYKSELEQLHVEQNMHLDDIMAHMKSKHDFDAT